MYGIYSMCIYSMYVYVFTVCMCMVFTVCMCMYLQYVLSVSKAGYNFVLY